MRIIREPSVYLVGRQVIDEEQIARFLADHEVPNWTTDTSIAGERLSEIAAS